MILTRTQNRRRRRLEARAYPDLGDLARWRARTRLMLFCAFVLGVLHVYLPALVMVTFAMPTGVRLIRRELAVGTLIAAAHRRQRRPRRPDVDLRDVYRRIL